MTALVAEKEKNGTRISKKHPSIHTHTHTERERERERERKRERELRAKRKNTSKIHNKARVAEVSVINLVPHENFFLLRCGS